MPFGTAADIGFGNRIHWNGGLYAGIDTGILKRILQRQSVHHGCQHAHIIGGGTFHATGGTGNAAENVTAADDQTDLYAHIDDSLDLGGDTIDHYRIETIFTLAHQRFAGNFQQNTLIFCGARHVRSQSVKMVRLQSSTVSFWGKAGLLCLQGCGNFRCEVAFFLLDALTQSQTNHGSDFHRCAQFLASILENF